VETLRARDAIRLLERAELASGLAELLSGSPEARGMGARGREVFDSEAGATERSVQALLTVLQLESAHAAPAETRV
jgi:3-deoxy-D-manno-octulosonic-acid transferase